VGVGPPMASMSVSFAEPHYQRTEESYLSNPWLHLSSAVFYLIWMLSWTVDACWFAMYFPTGWL